MSYFLSCITYLLRFAVVLKEHGFKKGDFVHTVVGNVQGVFAAMGGIWLLGGKVSGGDTALDSKAIAGQVNVPSFESCHVTHDCKSPASVTNIALMRMEQSGLMERKNAPC